MKIDLKLGSELAELTGYVAGLAKWDERMPKSTRILLLRKFISFWNEIEPDSPTVQGWIKEWNDEIDRISKL
jgi:uncharacterized protein Usg